MVRVTWIAATQPLHDGAAADAELERLRRDEDAREELVAGVLLILNMAVRAHRAAAQDPYLPELAREDPRAVRFGVGSAQQLMSGEWREAFLAPPARVEKVDRAVRLGPSETVALVLRGALDVLESEELLLRARLDVDQGRWRCAALQLHAALTLLEVEVLGVDGAEPWGKLQPEDLALRADRVRALRDLELAGELDEIGHRELAAQVEDVAAIFAAWRAPIVEHV